MTIERYLGAGAGALVAWVAALAVVELTLDPTPTVIAFGPRSAIVGAAGLAGAAVTGLGQLATQVRAAQPGLARTLYGSGAWLVLPIPDSLCFGDPPRR